MLPPSYGFMMAFGLTSKLMMGCWWQWNGMLGHFSSRFLKKGSRSFALWTLLRRVTAPPRPTLARPLHLCSLLVSAIVTWLGVIIVVSLGSSLLLSLHTRRVPRERFLHISTGLASVLGRFGSEGSSEGNTL